MRYTGFLLYKLMKEAIGACRRQHASMARRPRRRGGEGSVAGEEGLVPLLVVPPDESDTQMVTHGAIRSELRRQEALRAGFSSHHVHDKCVTLLKFSGDFILTALLAGASFAKSYAFMKSIVDLIYRGMVLDDRDLSNDEIDTLRLTLRIVASFGLAELFSMLIWKLKFKTPVTHTSRFFEEPGEVFFSFVQLVPRFVAFSDNRPGDADLNRSHALAYFFTGLLYTLLTYTIGAYDNYHVRVSRRDRALPLRFLSYLPFPIVMAAFGVFALDFLIPPTTLESFTAEEIEGLKFGISGLLASSSVVRIFAEKNVKRLMYRDEDDRVGDFGLKEFRLAKWLAITSAFFLTGLQGLFSLDIILSAFQFSCSNDEYGNRAINDYAPSCSFILILASLMAVAAGFDVYRNYSPSLTQAHARRYPEPKPAIIMPNTRVDSSALSTLQESHREAFSLSNLSNLSNLRMRR